MASKFEEPSSPFLYPPSVSCFPLGDSCPWLCPMPSLGRPTYPKHSRGPVQSPLTENTEKSGWQADCVAVIAWEVKQGKSFFKRCVSFLYSCVYVYIYVGLRHFCGWCPPKPEKDIVSLDPGMIGRYKPPDVGTGNWTWVLWKSDSRPYCLSHLSSHPPPPGLSFYYCFCLVGFFCFLVFCFVFCFCMKKAQNYFLHDFQWSSKR